MQRHTFLFAAMLGIAVSATAQAWYIPNSTASTGGCNVIPFGDVTPSATWSNQKYQTIVMAADLGSLPGLITGLAFAPCGSGDRDIDSIQVVMDHIPAATTSLSTTFANNLTANAVTVLSATNFTWRQIGNTWTDIGLQNWFVFNGTDNLVIEVTCFNGRGNVSSPQVAPSGFHTENRQRVYVFTWAGSPPPTGGTDNAALKMEVTMLMGRASLHGRGCPQSNGVRPNHVFSGTPQLGQTLGLDLQAALPNSLAVVGAGGYAGIPFPLDLASYGFPGCFAYFAIDATVVLVASASGTASQVLTVPNSAMLVGARLHSQYFCLDPVTARLTTSNYGAILVGN